METLAVHLESILSAVGRPSLGKIYTRRGDDGSTGLFGGPRVRKDDLRVAAYGDVDELNSALGMAREEILHYAVSLVRATREHPAIAVGASPRAALWTLRAAKAIAALEGRGFVLPEDVQAVIRPALRHRVVLEPGAEVEGMGADDAIDEVMRTVAVPH